MSGSAIVSMILIVGVVVGGFVFFMIKALKNEKDK